MNIVKLIDRVKAGEADALNTIYETYAPMMRGVCIKIIQEDEDTVDDLVQEAFILAYFSLDKLKDASKFGEWVSSITKNVSLRYLEKKKKMQLIPFSTLMGDEMDVDAVIAPDSIFEEKEILELIGKLPTGYRNVFRMAVIEGYSHKEIAQKLGIEAHSSSSQLTRAKAMLRKMINKQSLAIISVILLVGTPLYKYLFTKKEAEKQKLRIATIRKENRKKSEATEERESSSISAISNKQIALVANSKMHSCNSPLDSTETNNILENVDTIANVVIATISNDSLLRDTSGAHIPEIENFVAENSVRSHKNNWQLLATGTLGTALAQNVYKIIANNNNGLPDTDGPAPIIPTHITTWEDYYTYQVNNYKNFTADTLALMDIALHNSGDIVEHEYHDKPVTFGISLTKSINDRWNMETGLQYSFLKSRFVLGDGGYYINKVQKIHYLGIPLRMSYKLLGSKKWSVYTSAGILLNIPLNGKAEEQYVTGTTIPYTNDWNFTPPFQWSVGAGLGMQYKFAQNWGVYIEPTVNWYIPNGSTIHTIWTEHPFTITAPFGIRYTW